LESEADEELEPEADEELEPEVDPDFDALSVALAEDEDEELDEELVPSTASTVGLDAKASCLNPSAEVFLPAGVCPLSGLIENTMPLEQWVAVSFTR